MPVPRLRFTVLNTAVRGHQVEVIASDPIFVGRTSDNTLVLDHKSVSRRHARIECMGGAVTLVDLDSHNGTRVNGTLVEGPRAIQPGEALRFGEVDVKFEAVQEGLDPAAAQPTAAIPRDGAGPAPDGGEPASVPAVIGDPMLPTAPGERALSFSDVFGGAAATEEEAPAKARGRGMSPMMYGLGLLAVIVLGAIAIWRVGYRAPGPPIIGRKVMAGEVVPVDLARHMGRAERIGEPTTQRVAFAKKTRFPFIITVHGRSGGSTDIPVYDSGGGKVILRVVVTGVKPEPVWIGYLDEAPSKRVQRADDLIRRARLNTPKTDIVTGNTTKAIRDYEIAHRLLANIPGQERKATEASQEVRRLTKLRDARFDDISRLIEAKRRDGDYTACDKLVQQLLRVYHDAGSVEHIVIQYMYDVLIEDAAQAARNNQE